MKYVEMNKDVRQYKAKLLGPFSGREIICLALGVGAALLMHELIFAGSEVSLDVEGFAVLACVAPFVLVGWGKIYGMYIEVFIKSALRTVISPKIRKYDNGLKISRKPVRTKKSKDVDLQRMR